MHIFLSSASLKHIIICAHPGDQCQTGENGFPENELATQTLGSLISAQGADFLLIEGTSQANSLRRMGYPLHFTLWVTEAKGLTDRGAKEHGVETQMPGMSNPGPSA